MLVSHRQINDSQHHENECLQNDDQNVENRPRDRQGELNPERHQRDQDENKLAGVQVTEQSQRQMKWALRSVQRLPATS